MFIRHHILKRGLCHLGIKAFVVLQWHLQRYQAFCLPIDQKLDKNIVDEINTVVF